MVRDKGFYQNFAGLTLAIALQNLLAYSVNMADNVMLGAYQESALSGAALANQIQFFLQMLVTGVSEGIVVLCAQYWGKRQLEAIKKITGVGFAFGLLFSALLFIAVFFMPGQILSLLTNEKAVIAEGTAYLKIVCFTYVIFAMTNVLVATLRSVEDVHIGYVISLSTLLINICLNYVFIFGNLGAPELGIRGAAIATLVSRTVELLIVLCYLKVSERRLCLHVRNFIKLDFSYLRDYFHVAMPVIASQAQWGFAMAVQTGILGHLGQAAIAANSVATILLQIVSVISYGSASATAIIMGRTIGAGEKTALIKAYARTFQVIFLFIGVGTAVVLLIVRGPVLSIYSLSEDAKALSWQFMSVLAIACIGTAYQMAALCGIVRGGGDTRFVLINDLIFMWLIVIPSAALTAFVFNCAPIVVFLCLKSDQILKCAVAAVKVNRFDWIKNVTRPLQAK